MLMVVLSPHAQRGVPDAEEEAKDVPERYRDGVSDVALLYYSTAPCDASMIDSAQASTNRWEPTKRGRAQQCMDVCQFVHTLVMETDDHNKRRSSRSRARRPDRHQGKVPGGYQEQLTRRPHGCQVRHVLQVGVHVGLLRARLASSEIERASRRSVSSTTTPTYIQQFATTHFQVLQWSHVFYNKTIEVLQTRILARLDALTADRCA